MEPNGQWRVVDQRHITDVTAAGRFVDSMEVTVETNSGATFPIKIPLANYSADAVTALANSYAAEIERVSELGSR